MNLGEFTNIIPEALKFGFEILCKDTALEGADLVINLLPLKIECSKCGNISITEPGFFYCEKCGSNEVKIISGNEMKVVEIEIYDN